MRLLVPTLLAILTACAPTPNPSVGGAGASTTGSGGTPDIYREAVRRSELLGRALFEKDLASTIGTMVLLDSGYLAGEERIKGWVTQEGEGSWLVTYVAEENDRRTVGHEVVFPRGLDGPPAVAPTPPDLMLVGERAVMYTARQTALEAARTQCNTAYNTVVLPGTMIGEQGWLIYLLAATVNPGERVLAGHMMVRVSSDGLTHFGIKQLSPDCLIVPLELPEYAEHTGHIVTDLSTSWPLETHVYTSLWYGTPLYVQTRSGTWKVHNGKIELTDLASG